jgi:hypothetical protein
LKIIDNVFLTFFFKQVLFCLLKVPIDERNSVHEDAVKKLKKIWMGFNEIQLYTLSTKEALWIQKDDLIVGRFEKILQEIINLLPPSREQLLKVSTG